MSDNYSYTGLAVTTSNTATIEDNLESSDADSFEPKSLQVRHPSDWKSAITPIGTLTLGAALALGHHSFYESVNGRPVATVTVPQDWVTRIGVGFSFGFKSALGATMAFVLLQCLWFSVRRRPFTIKEIDTLYNIERSNKLYQTLPQALFSSPVIVLFSILALLLPLSGVFAPGSITVTTRNYTDVPGPCTIPTGNLSTPNASDSTSFFITGGVGFWSSVTPRVTTLTTQWFVEQRIPDLPQACGPNCIYTVSVPSFVMQCRPNPASLPYRQAGAPPESDGLRTITLWNGTTDPNSMWDFYIAWQSNGPNGTSGNACCSAVQAQYTLEVRTKEGIQSVTTNVSKVTSPIPDVSNPTLVTPANINGSLGLWMQLSSLSYSIQALLLGNATLIFGADATILSDNTRASQASFLSIPVASEDENPEFVWGDVLTGIEDFSHNVTAAFLTLQLGTMNTECLFDKQVVVYKYNRLALWVPYGTALCVTLLSLVLAIMTMTKHTGQITTSFSDTIMVTRRVEDRSADVKLRLRVVNGGEPEYMVE